MSNPVECAFVRHAIGRDPEVATHPVFPATGSSGILTRVRSAALREALARGAQQFAIPNVATNNGSWLVYRADDNLVTAKLIADMPTKTAAEMRMIHRGD